jgi:hypothetical protein
VYARFYQQPLGDDAPAIAIERRTIPDGDAGAAATVREMAKLIIAGSSAPLVRRMAVEIVRPIAPRMYEQQARAIRQWLARHVVFLRDPDGTELLHTPELMVRSVIANGTIHVDCDDVAILAGALGKSIGLLCRIVTVAFRAMDDEGNPLAPRTGFDATTPFAHTWAELSSPIDSPRWLEMDTTRAAQGVDPALIARSFVVDV